MGTTVNYSLPYPADSSPVAVPQDIQALADAIDGKIVGKTGGTFTGSVTFDTVPTCANAPTLGTQLANKTYVDAVQTNVNAINTELGSDPSGTYATVKARLDASAHPTTLVQDNAIARFNGNWGPIQESQITIDDDGLLTYPLTGGWALANGVKNLWGLSNPNSISIYAGRGSTYFQDGALNDVKGYLKWIKTTQYGVTTGWIADSNADTGWRSVSHNWSGYLYIRRIGQQVVVRTNNLSGITTNTAYTLPVGFRPPTNIVKVISSIISYNGITPITINTNGTITSSQYSDVFDWSDQIMFITDEAYPSTLPGSAV